MSSRRKLKPNLAAIIERVSQRDREWFERHPGEPCYVRPSIPGEFSGAGGEPPKQDTWVLVTRHSPDLRSRQPIGMQMVRRTASGQIAVIRPDGTLMLAAAFEPASAS